MQGQGGPGGRGDGVAPATLPCLHPAPAPAPPSYAPTFRPPRPASWCHPCAPSADAGGRPAAGLGHHTWSPHLPEPAPSTPTAAALPLPWRSQCTGAGSKVACTYGIHAHPHSRLELMAAAAVLPSGPQRVGGRVCRQGLLASQQSTRALSGPVGTAVEPIIHLQRHHQGRSLSWARHLSGLEALPDCCCSPRSVVSRRGEVLPPAL